jgi:hypothetical protein
LDDGSGNDSVQPQPLGAANYSEAPVIPKQYAPAIGATESSQSVDDAVRETLAGLDQADFAGLRVDSPPPGQPGRVGLWMYATVNAPSSSDGSTVGPEWEAYLAQGAIADRIAHGTDDLGLVIGGSTVLLNNKTGDPIEIGGGTGNVKAGRVFAAQAANESDKNIATSANLALAKFGLKATTLNVLHPLGPALYVVATTSDVATIKGQYHHILSALQGDGNYEGIYLEIDDSAGRALVRTGSAFRAGGGSVWFADGYDQILGIVHG